MVLVCIPLVGMVDISEDCLHMIGMVVVGQSVHLDPELYRLLIEEKFAGRYRSIGDTLRVRYGLTPLQKSVKRFSDEGDDHGICNTINRKGIA